MGNRRAELYDEERQRFFELPYTPIERRIIGRAVSVPVAALQAPPAAAAAAAAP